ncbi:DNA replication terminus site-binding protein [Terasakiispira papahanaumokuakeensis]|uniref:DNA replication terminus site-binding protein n=1 Tax=Terasakiispira papahanaumokuakeensis TaxID=197479 RepID=A0A1E2V7R8_9GAMM|nr:DNA replication terminus site-binding protein [Terasakiispira papahanaumokuakeensis]ODC02963.1 DNA replication terminus site-binding protein [Terasakiispira papahanaumokuakeensis]
MSEYRLLSQLDSSFNMLVQSLLTMAEALDQQNPQVWMLNDEQAPHHAAARALLDIWYEEGQDGRATRSHVGIVAASEALMQQAEGVNHCKQSFKEAIDVIRRKNPDLLSEARSRLAERHQALHQHMMASGLARLHLKQAWRQLAVVRAPLKQIRFSWYSSGRSIRKITVQQADQLLCQYNDEAPHIQIQRQRLAGIPSSEPLAQVQTQAPLMRANLFYQEPQEEGRDRKAMNVALPIFVLSPDEQLPFHNQPALEPPSARQRQRRRDNQLEDEAFLPSVRVYRYRDQ